MSSTVHSLQNQQIGAAPPQRAARLTLQFLLLPPAATAQAARQVDGDVAQVWCSQTRAAEATHLAQWLTNDMATRGRLPRDYALLVKQKSDDYERDLAGAFAAHGLRIRNESHALGKTSLQDLLSDDVCRLGIAMFRLGSTRRAPAAWQLASSSVLALRAITHDDETTAAKVEAGLDRLPRHPAS